MEMQLFPGPALCAALWVQATGDVWSMSRERASKHKDRQLRWPHVALLWVFHCRPTRKGVHCPVCTAMSGQFHPHCQALHSPVAGPSLLGRSLEHVGLEGIVHIRDSANGCRWHPYTAVRAPDLNRGVQTISVVEPCVEMILKETQYVERGQGELPQAEGLSTR